MPVLTNKPIVVLALMLLSCLVTGAVDVSGTWQLTRKASSEDHVFSLTLEQEGTDLVGSLVREGFPETTLSGTVDERVITFGHVVEEEGGRFSIVYEGTVDASGEQMEGTVHVEKEDGTPVGSTRSWSARRAETP